MTRDELIISEAKKYYYNNINCHNAFLHGVEWADEHSANVWHDASEPPKPNKWFIYEAYAEDQDPEYGAYFSAELEPITWGRMTVANEITRWAYVSDILPKGGEE